MLQDQPVSLASTWTPGPHAFYNYSGHQASHLGVCQRPSRPLRKLHRSASGPRPQGSTSCSRSVRFPATNTGGMMPYIYDDMYEKDPCRLTSYKGSFGGTWKVFCVNYRLSLFLILLPDHVPWIWVTRQIGHQMRNWSSDVISFPLDQMRNWSSDAQLVIMRAELSTASCTWLASWTQTSDSIFQTRCLRLDAQDEQSLRRGEHSSRRDEELRPRIQF